MTDTVPAGQALAAGWEWLSTLPRTAIAHAERGHDPLASVTGLLAALGNPHHRLKVIHIAGSKGKGSTALLIEALLRECGQRTFTFTSPHLERWTERLRLDGTEADPDRALAALQAVQRAEKNTGITPGFFEALTVAGLWLAADTGVDWAIVEAGVGGRADATNVVRPRICVITGVEREHTDRLGDTVEAIAREKSGIVKAGAPLVTPTMSPEVDAVMASAARVAGSEHIRVRRSARPPRGGEDSLDVTWQLVDGTLFAASSGWSARVPLAMPGDHMANNATLALATVGRLGLASREALQRSARVLAELRLPGRLETVSELPWVIVDGAHTPASAAALVAAVQQLDPPRLHLLLSLSAGKDMQAVLGALLPAADAVTVTRADPVHSMDSAHLAEAVRALRPDLTVVGDEHPESALGHAGNDHPGHALVLATGSVYLAGRIKGILSKPA